MCLRDMILVGKESQTDIKGSFVPANDTFVNNVINRAFCNERIYDNR